jgi:uncharacterized protein YndB with AHSA1/START domain
MLFSPVRNPTEPQRGSLQCRKAARIQGVPGLASGVREQVNWSYNVAKTKTMNSTIEIAAPPEAIFDVVANPHRHPEIDGSGTLNATVEGPDRLSLGARFKVKVTQRGRFSYPTINRVVEFEEDQRIAWKHWGPQVWRYEFEPVSDGSTRVTETFDYSGYRMFAGFARRMFAGNQEAMDRTLARLKAMVEDEASA